MTNDKWRDDYLFQKKVPVKRIANYIKNNPDKPKSEILKYIGKVYPLRVDTRMELYNRAMEENND